MAIQNNRVSKTRPKQDRAAGGQGLDLWSLNEPQRAAVLHDAGPLLVLAGAGSGKTRVIIYRIARLIKDGISAKRIIGLTFTNKAAREMRQRLSVLAGSDAAGVTLCTFHALGLAMLQAEHTAAGLRPGFCIYDTSDQLSLVRDLMRQVKVADRRLDAHRVLDILLQYQTSAAGRGGRWTGATTTNWPHSTYIRVISNRCGLLTLLTSTTSFYAAKTCSTMRLCGPDGSKNTTFC